MAQQQPSKVSTIASGIVTVLLVLTAAFGLFLVVAACFGVTPGGHEVTLHQSFGVDRLSSIPPDALASDKVDVTLRIRDASRRQALLAMGRDLGPGLLVLAVLWFVRGVLRSVRDGDPFTAANVGRLRGIGFLLVIGVPVVALVSSELAATLSDTSPFHGSSGGLHLTGNGLVAGLGIFLLAEVFARGVGLREDIEGTV
jgi:hypothetical protein